MQLESIVTKIHRAVFYNVMSANLMNDAGIFSDVGMKEDTFENFFHANYQRVYALLYRLTGERAEAEDLTSETFVRLWRRFPADSSNVRSWLLKVAVRLGYNSLRTSKRRERYEQKAGEYELNREPFTDPVVAAERAKTKLLVRNTLRRMSRRDSQLLVLHHSGFSYKEIASALGVSPNSIGTLLARAEREFERIFNKGD